MEFVVYEDQVMSQDGMGGYSISEYRVDGPGDGMSLSRVFRDDGTVQSGMAVPACLQDCGSPWAIDGNYLTTHGLDCSVAEVFLCGHGVDWAVAVPGCSFAMEVKPREVGCAQCKAARSLQDERMRRDDGKCLVELGTLGIEQDEFVF
ncbi:hypothetical protein CCUS01_16078 [Colletotrichum cuscutae]|uniref:Uncharacterized protein n=1 Tax=Colletotrichum cuscutae TaxID=1209917 RepID=A0AAI9VC91_9PEZI|nr:hypothetical protein CCUS01_16078 [Colletotrichum cuscutae]